MSRRFHGLQEAEAGAMAACNPPGQKLGRSLELGDPGFW